MHSSGTFLQQWHIRYFMRVPVTMMTNKHIGVVIHYHFLQKMKSNMQYFFILNYTSTRSHAITNSQNAYIEITLQYFSVLGFPIPLISINVTYK